MTEKSTEKADKLTDKSVRDIPPPPTGNRITYDGELKGFGIRVTSAGARAFVLNYRAGARERRITIGSYPDWTVSAARDEAKALKKRVDQGEDPMQARQEAREAPTVADLAQLYRDIHMPRKRPGSREADEALLANHILPRLARERVTDIRRTHVARLHRDISKTMPIAANRCMALLSKMFAVAMAEEWRDDNPCKGIERNPENKRERFLTPAEIGRLGNVLATHPERTSCNAIRLLLLTGARKSEVLEARWQEFDLDAGVWVKPSAHTKSKKTHRIPLAAPALALLSDMRAAADPDCPFLFPGQISRAPGADGKRVVKPLSEIKRTWHALCRAAELSGVRIHDLRHTYASVLASAGLSLPVIGALLGHTQTQTTARYAHLLDDPLRAATERAAAVITGAGLPGADVLSIAGRVK